MAKVNVSKEELAALYAEHKTALAVAKQLGCCKKSILDLMKAYEMPRTGKREMSAEVKEQVRRMAAEGSTTLEIIKETGFTQSAISRLARIEGFKITDNFHKGFILTDNGYKMLLRKDHPNADSKGYVREHILVMEDHLGRHLRDGEVVHHKDEDKLNNSLSNLELMLDSEHRRLHAIESDAAGRMRAAAYLKKI